MFLPFSCVDLRSQFRFPKVATWPGCKRHTEIFCLITPLINELVRSGGNSKERNMTYSLEDKYKKVRKANHKQAKDDICGTDRRKRPQIS